MKDTENCTITGNVANYVSGNYKSDPSLGLGTGACLGGALVSIPFIVGGRPFCWLSDFNGAVASQFKFTFGGNGDSFQLSVVAYYN